MELHDFMDDLNKKIQNLNRLLNMSAYDVVKEKNEETTLTPHYLWNEKRGVVKEWTAE